MEKRGRPIKNKQIASLRVRTWFNAVSQASGKTAYQLEMQFSAGHTAFDKEYRKNRPRLWEKYKQGKIEPSSKPIKGAIKSIAERVEDVYPGTLYWLICPLWKLLDYSNPVTMEDLKGIYYSLDFSVRKYLVHENLPEEYVSTFWRKHCSPKYEVVEPIFKDESFDAVIALGALIRESILIQDTGLYSGASFALITLLERQFGNTFDVGSSEVRSLVIDKLGDTWIPVENGDSYKYWHKDMHKNLLHHLEENIDSTCVKTKKQA